MSVSTDAILFWGIHYNEGELPPDEDKARMLMDAAWKMSKEQEDRAVQRPGPEFDLERARADSEYDRAWNEWRDRRNAWEKSQCDVHAHCSGQYPLYYVCPNESRIVARRGCPGEITSLSVGPDWEHELRVFCQRLQLPWKEPKWWLVSYWG